MLAPATAVADDSSDPDQQAASPQPWVRSIVCPVLYAHEIVSQAVLRRFLVGLIGSGYQPVPLWAVDAAMAGDNEERLAKLNRCDDSYYKSAEPVAERLFAFIKANQAGIRF